MRDGFVKVAAVTPKIRVADTTYNAGVIVEGIREAAAAGAKVIVLPELVITGYTCSDLFLQEYLLEQAKRALGTIAEETAEVDAILFVGLPLAYNGKLYNVAAVLCRGEVLGFVPKTYLRDKQNVKNEIQYRRKKIDFARIRTQYPKYGGLLRDYPRQGRA